MTWFLGLFLMLSQFAPLLTLDVVHGFEPLNVLVRITVLPHIANRGLCVVWESDNATAGSSCWELEGEQARPTHHFVIKSLPKGDYVVRAELILDTGKHLFSAAHQLHVLER